MSLLDQIILLATGLVAIYLLWRFFTHYQSSKTMSDIWYLVSFAVLLVAGLLLIFLSYSVLANPLVVIVAVLIPAALSLGLVTALLPKYAKAYLVFAIIGLLAVAVTRLMVTPSTLATIVLVIVHTVAGLLIFGLPIWAVMNKKAPAGFLGVTIGGVLIGVGGIALTFLKLGTQLLFFSQALVLTILAPLLLLMTLAFAWGFVVNMKAQAV